MYIKHFLFIVSCSQTYLIDALTEALEHCEHVSTLLHGYESGVVLLVDPDKEVLLVVVEDGARVGPVTGHAWGQEKRGDGLVEEEVVLEMGKNICMFDIYRHI